MRKSLIFFGGGSGASFLGKLIHHVNPVLMELSAEGLAAAAATRETLALKKRLIEEVKQEPKQEEEAAAPERPPKRQNMLLRPPPTCSHEVAVPEGYQPDTTKDPAVHGAQPACMHGHGDGQLMAACMGGTGTCMHGWAKGWGHRASCMQ